ncbi:MAG: SAM-dependent methyltransferase [Planctomycetes bacterium]|nr:SAM-dependent methyltransferase [Planctomycetota bacterium]
MGKSQLSLTVAVCLSVGALNPAYGADLARRLTAEVERVHEKAKYDLVSLGAVKRYRGSTFLVLKRKYAPGLVSLDDFSHVMVFYWFDRNDTPEKRSILQGHRPGKKDPLTGIFATRAAVRPNLIAFSTCKIVSIRDNIVEIDGIDAFDDSPVLDLKPYIPRNDSYPEAQIPEWAGGRRRR